MKRFGLPLLFLFLLPFARLEAVEKSPDALLANLLTGIETVDLDKFTEKATPDFKNRITRDMLVKTNTALGARLKRGYTTEYLGLLAQHGLIVYLYKVQFKDSSDDILVRLETSGGLVAGFGLQ